MNLEQYLEEDIGDTFAEVQILEDHCNTFTKKLYTEEELYNEITIAIDK